MPREWQDKGYGAEARKFTDILGVVHCLLRPRREAWKGNI